MKNYIILEIIPTSSNPAVGEIAQLSALKVADGKLVRRFDYRTNYNKILNKDIVDMLSYDADAFFYKDNATDIMDEFKDFIGNDDLLIIDNAYTKNYLLFYNIENKTLSVSDELNMSFHEGIVDEIINKYNLQLSNYIVDLLYEALIYSEND